MLRSGTLNTDANAPATDHLNIGDGPRFPYQTTEEERSRAMTTCGADEGEPPELTLLINIPSGGKGEDEADE